MNDSAGRTLGRYELGAMLGAGGMGEVYRALDQELKREVAVKVLPRLAEGDTGRIERFAREARAVARLSHPNILEIFDFGHDSGQIYAVTELLDGETLRERLRGGPLKPHKAVIWSDAIARGLGAAHGHGVVHRDVKPENIFITADGRVKILDFGIARLRETDDAEATADTTLTDPHAIVGSIGYMAPEQVRGKPADARSDVFALGCVMYEMLTGQRAFRCANPGATLSAILNDEPKRPSELVPDLPSGVERIVLRCLEKQPDERFQSAQDVAYALRAAEGSRGLPDISRHRPRRRVGKRLLAAGAVGVALSLAGVTAFVMWLSPVSPPALQPEHRHLAVLEISSNADDPRARLLAAGLTEALARNLSLVEEETHGEVWVLPVATAKTRARDELPRLARRYGVGAGITGKLRSQGDSYRLELDLVEPRFQRVLSSTAVEDHLANAAAFQVEPVLRVAEMLGITTTTQIRNHLEQSSTNVVASFEAFLIGLGRLAGADSVGDIRSAIESLTTAVERDPTFGAARCALAEAHLRYHQGFSGPESSLVSARRDAQIATADPSVAAEGNLLLTEIFEVERRFDEALESLGRAAGHRPSNGEIQLQLARALERAGQEAEAKSVYRRAIYLRPGYWPGHHWLARLHLENGRYEDAAAEFRQVIAAAPESRSGYLNLGRVYELLGRRDDAYAMFERSVEVDPDGNYLALTNLGGMYFDDSRFGDAVRILEQALAIRDDSAIVWGNLAWSYHSGVDPEKATDCFRRAAELAEAEREPSHEDPRHLVRLAGYYWGMGELDKGKEVLTLAISLGPRDPDLMAKIAGTAEDLGNRELALEWVERALEAGLDPARFLTRPTLKDLITDPRFQELVADAGGVSAGE